MVLSHRSIVRFGRAFILVVAVAIGAATVTSCGDDSAAAEEDATILDVSLGRYVIEPSTLQALPGNLVLRVTNNDPDMVHNLVVHGKGTRELAPGESQTLEVPDVTPGEYPMWCDMPGHAAAGQTGTLMVSLVAPPAATPTT